MNKFVTTVFLTFVLTSFAPAVFAVPIVVENSIDRFELSFDHDDSFGPIAPVGALDGRTVDIVSGGESASIAISVAFRSSGGALEDLIFIFESLTTDVLFPGSVAPGTVLVYSNSNGFAGADAVLGDGLMPGYLNTTLTVVAGPDRDNAFSATLVLSNEVAVPEPSTLGLLCAGLLGLAFVRRRRAV